VVVFAAVGHVGHTIAIFGTILGPGSITENYGKPLLYNLFSIFY
jgi:hypothetical protein